MTALLFTLLWGCNAAQPTVSPLPGGLEPAARAAKAVCPAHRGEARCLALIEPGVDPATAGLTPTDFQSRYKLPSGTKGNGQIVAVVGAYDNPNVDSDLAAYRAKYSLGTATFTKYNQQGETSNYPQGSSSWGLESDLDVEMIAAVCPLCTIYLIEANGSDGADLETAETEAVKLGAHIVTNSWTCVGSSDCVNPRAFAHKHVTYVAASGDSGDGIGAPAAYATVVSVGGTLLTKNGSNYVETIWDPSEGGCAAGIKKPKWQHDTYCNGRLANDAGAVSWDVAAYDSYGYGGWFSVGGTSVSAPLVAGIFGLAGNASKQDGGRTFWQASHHKDLYVLGGSCNGYGYGPYTACTGWGSPKGIGAF
ncbi:MAG TPA: S8 family serine peptidase [Candidatus Binatia bacterium]|nr:S8 family serine peptidase [Candidatus Binatia bacterium]